MPENLRPSNDQATLADADSILGAAENAIWAAHDELEPGHAPPGGELAARHYANFAAAAALEQAADTLAGIRHHDAAGSLRIWANNIKGLRRG